MRIKIDRSKHPNYKKDHVSITSIDNNGDGWMRIGYTGIRISHYNKNSLNIIGVDII